MDEWISVDERLPHAKMLLLAYRPTCRNKVATIFYDDYMERWGGSHEVTHWMPLPEPPQGISDLAASNGGSTDGE